jgi:hypothetical protein
LAVPEVAGAGLEPLRATTSDTTELGKSPNPDAAKSGAFRAANALVDPDLQAIIERWPELPEVVKAGILAMVRATP